MSAVSEWSDAGWILRVPSSLAVTSHCWAAEPSGSSIVTAPLSSSARAVSAFPLDLSVIVYDPLSASRSNESALAAPDSVAAGPAPTPRDPSGERSL